MQLVYPIETYDFYVEFILVIVHNECVANWSIYN